MKEAIEKLRALYSANESRIMSLNRQAESIRLAMQKIKNQKAIIDLAIAELSIVDGAQNSPIESIPCPSVEPPVDTAPTPGHPAT